MTLNQNITALINEHRTLFIAMLVGLFLLELEIFAVAVVKSGQKSSLEIRDSYGRVVYETEDQSPASFDQKNFEKTFGPIDRYQVQYTTREEPFPFRAWFTAAVGLPLGGMLLFAFIVRAFVAVFHGEKRPRVSKEDGIQQNYQNRIDWVLDKVNSLHIFTIGFFVFLVVIAYWIVPNIIVYLGKLGFETLERYKWFFGIGAGALLCVFVWVIYLRYLLAKRHIDSQVELDKYRLRLEYEQGHRPPLPLEAPKQERRTDLLVGNTVQRNIIENHPTDG